MVGMDEIQDRQGPPLRILLAEDNVVNQRVAQLMLTKLGHRVHIVEDGAAAVEAVKGPAYDVVLMDIEMPKMGGLEACQLILRHFGTKERPYIIALTAHADRAACLAAGVDNYLRKPVRTADLAKMLSYATTTTGQSREEHGQRHD